MRSTLSAHAHRDRIVISSRVFDGVGVLKGEVTHLSPAESEVLAQQLIEAAKNARSNAAAELANRANKLRDELTLTQRRLAELESQIAKIEGGQPEIERGVVGAGVGKC